MEWLCVSEKERNNTTREDTRGSGGTAGTHMDIGNKDKNSKLGDFLRKKLEIWIKEGNLRKQEV